jgi:hypothetical protein
MRLYDQNIKSIVRQFLPQSVFGGLLPTVRALVEEGFNDYLETPFETEADERVTLHAIRAFETLERHIRAQYPDVRALQRSAEALLRYFDTHERIIFAYGTLDRWAIAACTLVEDVLVLIDVYYS